MGGGYDVPEGDDASVDRSQADPTLPFSAGGQDSALADVFAISELLMRVAAISRSVERPVTVRGVGLSPHAIRATMHLYRHEKRTVGELAEGLGVSIGWASRIADELERAGYMERERDANDRRVVRLRLSPAARSIADQMYQERGIAVSQALEGMDVAQRLTVQHFLEQLLERLAEEQRSAA